MADLELVIISEHQYSPFQVEACGAREYDPLDVAPLANQIRHRIAMADGKDILLDDRPFIHEGRYTGAGDADELYVTSVVVPQATTSSNPNKQDTTLRRASRALIAVPPETTQSAEHS